jgi:hypothetical protein
MTVAYSYPKGWGMVAEGYSHFLIATGDLLIDYGYINLNITSPLTARLRFFPRAVLSVI